MSNDLAAILEKVIVQGDLTKLSNIEKVNYVKAVCESVGLNPLTKPFEFIYLNGKLTLYALRGATDQLRKIHGVSIEITSREMIGEVYVVTATAKTKDGRSDSSTGAVCLSELAGDNLANAYMKAETKAKRRVTLSLCGLGLLDESEVETIVPTRRQGQPVVRSEGGGVSKNTSVLPLPNQASKGGDTRAPSDAQLKRLFAITNNSEWMDSDIAIFIGDKYDVSLPGQLTRPQYKELCDAILAGPPPKPEPASPEVKATVDEALKDLNPFEEIEQPPPEDAPGDFK